jgi:hypothetical protein
LVLTSLDLFPKPDHSLPILSGYGGQLSRPAAQIPLRRARSTGAKATALHALQAAAPWRRPWAHLPRQCLLRPRPRPHPWPRPIPFPPQATPITTAPTRCLSTDSREGGLGHQEACREGLCLPQESSPLDQGCVQTQKKPGHFPTSAGRALCPLPMIA